MILDVTRRKGLGMVAGVLTLASSSVACSSSTADDGKSQAALAAPSETGGEAGTKAAERPDIAPCLTRFAVCIRDGGDDKTCHGAFLDCATAGHEARRGGGDCAERRAPLPPDGEAPMPPPPLDRGRDGAPLPPPPPPGDDASRPPPPPPGDGPWDGPKPPDGGADQAGPRTCFDELATCARGSQALETCVDAAVACLAALPPPTPPPPRGGFDGAPREPAR